MYWAMYQGGMYWAMYQGGYVPGMDTHYPMYQGGIPTTLCTPLHHPRVYHGAHTSVCTVLVNGAAVLSGKRRGSGLNPEIN